MSQILAVAVGGAIGSVGRFLIASLINQRNLSQTAGPLFPYGILLVNALGSFLIGFVFIVLNTRFATHESQDLIRAFAIIGLLGGFTTFSTFSLDTLQLLQYGLWGKALLNIIVSLVICIAGAGAGTLLARTIT